MVREEVEIGGEKHILAKEEEDGPFIPPDQKRVESWTKEEGHELNRVRRRMQGDAKDVQEATRELKRFEREI